MYSQKSYCAIKNFMTEELWKLFRASPQKLEEFLHKSITWKAQICYQRISIIRPYWLSNQSESESSLSKNHEASQ